MSSRARYFCAMIRAWNSTCAAEPTFSVSSAMYLAPPASSNSPRLRNCSVTVSMSMGRWVVAKSTMAA